MSDQALRRVAPATRTRSYVDGSRLLRAFIFGAWSAFFAWLWLSGEMSRYLGPRTYWVVPFGAAMLAVAAVLHVATLRVSIPRARPSVAEMVGVVVLVVPLLAVAAVPDADLGSLAASRKSTGSGVSAAEALSPEAGEPVVNPSFRDIAYAQESRGYADAIGLRDGTDTTLVGFVDGAGPPGTFELTRFYVSCCAADAIPYSVAVEPPAGEVEALDDDRWAQVEGILELRGDRFVLVAERLRLVDEPDDPYLY